MPTVLDGTVGTVAFGPTGSSTNVLYLTQFEYEVKTDVKTLGPYIGDANKSKVRAGRELTFSGEGVVVTTNDAGQVLVHSKINTDADVQVVYTANANTKVTIPTAILTSLKMTQKSDEGVTFTFDGESSGGYTEVFT